MLKLIREEHYEQMMKDVVEPGLAAMREEMEMPLEDGGTLHAEIYNRYDAKRAVVIVHGYTESAEKFRELVWYFLYAGFSVFSYDQRGHGKSVRVLEDTSVTHVDHFSDYLDDLRQFMEKIVLPRMSGAPVCVFGHSMGGAVAAFALMKHPDWFARAVLNAPMIAPVTKPLSRRNAVLMGKIFALLGKGRERAFVGKPFDPAREKFDTSHMTSKPRFDYYQHKRNTRKELQNCSPTYSWVREAAAVTEPLLAGAASIHTPVLMCQAALDSIVGLQEQDQFIALVPGGRKIVFQAKHEIYSSEQSVMEEYVKTIIDFLSEE